VTAAPPITADDIDTVADIPLCNGALLCVSRCGDGWAVTVATPDREDALAVAAVAMAVLGGEGCE